jgi:hypothetical protein
MPRVAAGRPPNPGRLSLIVQLSSEAGDGERFCSSIDQQLSTVVRGPGSCRLSSVVSVRSSERPSHSAPGGHAGCRPGLRQRMLCMVGLFRAAVGVVLSGRPAAAPFWSL